MDYFTKDINVSALNSRNLLEITCGVQKIDTFENTVLLCSLRLSEVGKKNMPTAYPPSGGSSNPTSLET